MILSYEVFKEKYPKVSHETHLKIKVYVELIIKWNKKINIVSRFLIERNEIEKHVFDSLGLIDYIPSETSLIVDVGSGSGFPGIILAIMGYKVILIEINLKKSTFLKEVIYRLGLSAEVIEEDVKNVADITASVITTKAFSNVTNVINWTSKIRANPCRYLFLKKHTQEREVKEFENNDYFRLNILQNKYNTEGIIIQVDTTQDG